MSRFDEPETIVSLIANLICLITQLYHIHLFFSHKKQTQTSFKDIIDKSVSWGATTSERDLDENPLSDPAVAAPLEEVGPLHTQKYTRITRSKTQGMAARR